MKGTSQRGNSRMYYETQCPGSSMRTDETVLTSYLLHCQQKLGLSGANLFSKQLSLPQRPIITTSLSTYMHIQIIFIHCIKKKIRNLMKSTNSWLT